MSKDTSSDLTLDVQGHDEIRSALTANANEWRGVLPEAAYFEREAVLASQTLTRDGGLTPWQLSRSSSTKDGCRTQLAACETLRKRALATIPSGTGSGRLEVRDVQCQGVASVFTPPSNRGRGYAGTMISKLGERLDAMPDCTFSVLYSDIGRDFYARHGWKAMSSAHLVLYPVSGGEWPSGVRRLTTTDLAELCARDQMQIRRRMEALATQGQRAVAILPDEQTLSWHLAREAFVAKRFLGRIPEVIGALTTTASGVDVWCIWTRWWYGAEPGTTEDNTLHVLRVAVDADDYDASSAQQTDAEDPTSSEIVGAVARLLTAATIDAAQWVMGDVQVWNPSRTTLAAARRIDHRASVIRRDKDSIASLRWCDDKSGPTGTDEILWLANEKFAWC